MKPKVHENILNKIMDFGQVGAARRGGVGVGDSPCLNRL
jgi:hypothetical protein